MMPHKVTENVQGLVLDYASYVILERCRTAIEDGFKPKAIVVSCTLRN
jgi:DNA gyrase/topoisomerase IV subunit A